MAREFAELLDEHLRAGYQCLHINTSEEARCETEINRVAKAQGLGVVTWDFFEGFSAPESVKGQAKYRVPAEALRAIVADDIFKGNQLFVLRDLDDFFPDPVVRRTLKSLTEGNRLVNKKYKRPVIIISPVIKIHEKIKTCMTPLDFVLPDEAKLRSTFKFVKASVESGDRSKAACSQELEDQIVQALMGLTSIEAENALARCLVRHDGFKPEMLWTIKDEKASIVKKSEVLTYIPEQGMASRDEIGGFDRLLEFIDRRRLSYTRKAREVKLDFPKGIVLLGVPGCVADDTLVYYRRGKRKSAGGRCLSIRDFHDKFNGVAIRQGRCGAPWAPDLDTYLQSFDAATGKVFYNKVKGVYEKGYKECVRIATDIAGSITLTADHPVLMADATFKPAGEVRFGEQLLVRGSMLPQAADAPAAVKRPRVVLESLKYYPQGWPHPVTEPTSGKVYEYKRTHRARLVVEAHMNGLPYEEFVRILQEEPERAETLVYLEPTLEVHHMDEDTQNDALDNLAVMTKSEHTGLHLSLIHISEPTRPY